jgi:hypothetical protein
MFVKFFKRLVNVAVCNMFIICNNSISKQVSHKSQVLLNLIDHQSTIHQKDFLGGTSFKRSLICRGRGHGTGRGKKLERKCGVCLLPMGYTEVRIPLQGKCWNAMRKLVSKTLKMENTVI